MSAGKVTDVGTHQAGPWVIVYEGEPVIKREVWDHAGSYQGYELLTGDYGELGTLIAQNADTVTALRAAYAVLPKPDHTGDITVVDHPRRGVDGISKPDAENNCACAVHTARRLAALALAKLGAQPMKLEPVSGGFERLVQP